MTQSTDDQILRYLKDQSALDQNMGRRVKDIMTGIALDVQNVRIALHRMLGNGLAETSNANMISGGVPASFRPDKEQREGWQRDYLEPVIVWLGPTAKAAMAEEAKQAKRDDDLHVLAEAARDRLGSGPTIKPMDEYTTQVERLKVLMTSGATDLAITEVEEREYTQLRSTLLREGRFKKLAPKFVMTCGSLKEFKRHMQTISDNYKGRRENIKSEFRELISSLFEDRSALDPVEDIAQHLDRPKLDLLPNDIQDRGNEMAEVYVYLYCIENSFRIFIGDIMTREQVNFPTKVRDTIAKLKAQETTTPYLPVRGENDLYYCDFIQLGQIMVSNWAVFQKHFPQRNEHWLNGKMDELYQIRCLVAHNSYVGQHERDALKVHYRIIMKQLRIL